MLLYKKSTNFDGSIDEIDIYKTSKLSSSELKLLKLWIESKNYRYRDMFSDFLVFVLGFDKVETAMRRAITTTTSMTHVRFFNYYLMDYYIKRFPKMKYNSQSGLFEKDTFLQFKDYSEERKAIDEIKEIKSKVLLKDRHLFFR